MKKRWLVLNFFVALAIIVTSVLIVRVGNVYDIHTRYYPENRAYDNVSVTFDHENILALKGIYLNDTGEMIVSVKSVGRGYVDVKTRIDKNNTTVSSHFYVANLGTIFEKKFDGLNFTGYKVVMWELLIILVAIEIIMLWSFLECKKQSDFSDKRIAYGGILLFNLGLTGLSIFKVIRKEILTFSAFEFLLQESVLDLLFGLIPVMLLLSLSVVVGNIVIIRKNGYHRNNGLGIVLGILWSLVTFVVTALNSLYTDFGITSTLIEDLVTIIIYLIAYLECMILATCLCNFVERYSNKNKVWYTFPNTFLKRFKNVLVHQLPRHIAILIPIALFFIGS